jgi:hypothetical protein
MSAAPDTRRSTRSGKRFDPIEKKKETESTSQRVSKKKNPLPDLPTTASSTPKLYLRIARRLLNLIPAETEEQPIPPLPGTTGNHNVIIAPLRDLRPFSGDTVDWLIRVARLIFEPLGTGSLYTFTTGTVESWLEREMVQGQWRVVQDGEQLMSTIYEFRSDSNAPITLTRLSLRQARSVTTNTSADRGQVFRDALLRRHHQCIISSVSHPAILIASHLIPRRLGDSGVQSVIDLFTTLSTTVNRYNPMIGVPLLQTIDTWVDGFKLGFWNCGPVRHS